MGFQRSGALESALGLPGCLGTALASRKLLGPSNGLERPWDLYGRWRALATIGYLESRPSSWDVLKRLGHSLETTRSQS